VGSRMKRVSTPVAHYATRAFDHRNQCGKIVKLEPGFADYVDLSGSEHCIVVAIAAHDHPAMICLGRKRHEMFAVMIIEVVRAGGGKRRSRQLLARPHLYLLAVERGGPP